MAASASASTERRRRLAAATLMASFEGPVVPPWLVREIDVGLGSVCLFAGNLARSVTDVTAALHEARSDLIVAIDEEGGDVTRLWATTGSPVPGNAALGAVDDPALTGAVAGALGAALRSAGVDLDLAPVADVNTDPANPAIGVRSFGADAETVARHVAAFVGGLQGQGVAACAKHFPGHGATAVDSHLALPVTEGELVPFQTAIAAGTATVMAGHLVVTALDDRPATLSHRLLTDVLRTRLGFDGAIVTDALDMGALGGIDCIPANAAAALAAGADLCCLGPGCTEVRLTATIDAVVASVDEGRLAEAATRVAAIPRRGAGPATPDIAEIGLTAARRAIRTSGDPKLRTSDAHVVELETPAMIAAGPVPWSLASALNTTRSVALGSRSARPQGDKTEEGAEVVVVAYRDAHRYPEVERRLRDLVAAHPDAILVDMGWPHPDPPPARGRIITFGAAPPCARAAAEVLTGD
jgi:beta-N-acetylhexosaminidase